MKKAINIKKSNKETINRTGNTILRSLHEVLNLDFQKDHAIFEIFGNFTVKQALTIADENGYNPVTSTIAVILKDSHFNEYNLVTLDKFGGYNHEYKVWYKDSKNAKLRNYLRKSDFDADRKKETAHGFIICQKFENNTEYHEFSQDYKNRVKLREVRKWCDGHGNTYIGDIEFISLDCDGKKGTNKGTFHRKETEIKNVIDKSGYFVYIKRADLAQAAKKLRADRLKADYNKVDNSGKISDLAQMIENAKMKIVKKLETVKTYDDISKLAAILDHSNGLKWIMFDYELLAKRDSNKEYASAESFENAYNRIIEKINALEV